MADPVGKGNPSGPAASVGPSQATTNQAASLSSGAYEVIRQRLTAQSAQLRDGMRQLDEKRAAVFGRVESRLLQSDRVSTAHNCTPRDMVQLDESRFLFGFNVQFGLKKEIELGDVFAVFARDEQAGNFREAKLEILEDKRFVGDFKRLYNIYEKTSFSKFSLIDGNLFMVFRTGAAAGDIAVFKWTWNQGVLKYVDGRSESEFRKNGFPPSHPFRWSTPGRESFRYGDHPHVSIEDRVFVECVGGDLTIKIEDNTATGEGIFSEPVEDRHQKVDDAEIAYAILGSLIVLRIRPYKESVARYFIYNEKLQSVTRVDSLGMSCALLPEEHGLIFPDGYQLATGELKVFESREEPMTLERVVHSPNGEDSLFVFFSRDSGEYALLPYRLIDQKVEERVVCHGFSLFPNGKMVLFRADELPQKHHQVQLRQTPFHQVGYEPEGRRDAYLYQVGNKEVVRCLSECHEVWTLSRKEPPYAELYSDLGRRCGAMLDAYGWLMGADGCGIGEVLKNVRDTADKAVDEFAKVRRLQHEAVQRVGEIRKRCDEQFQAIRRAGLNRLEDFVHSLAALRRLRGELITLREVRYVDLSQLSGLEKSVISETDALSAACAKFLLKSEALDAYRTIAKAQLAAVDGVQRVSEGKKIAKETAAAGSELEMLIEIVNGLKIEDAAEATRIIDSITAVYSTLNQVRSGLKKRLESLTESEGSAQFHAQLKLLGQSASSYLDLCDSPERCDEYLNRVTVQIEEMEGSFAGFEGFVVQLAERRTELYEAFEQRKIALVEQRNRRASALVTAADRILKVVQNRLGNFKSLEEMNAYMASDPMIAKTRETMEQLMAMGDSVKADELAGRLKATQQEAVRQLKDRQELFVDGAPVIQLGRHRFNVNTQPLDLTIVLRDGTPHFHLTSTRYFDPIVDEKYLATRPVWEQEYVSENASVYRGEYLAWRWLKECESTRQRGSEAMGVSNFLALPEPGRLERIRDFMGARYSEGYTKGLHDSDGAAIASALLETHGALGLARFHPDARACAVVFWAKFCQESVRGLWMAQLKGFADRNRVFPGDPSQQVYIEGLRALLAEFVRETRLFSAGLIGPAGEYLFHELVRGGGFTITREADETLAAFHSHLVVKGSDNVLEKGRQALSAHPIREYELVRDWVRGFLLSNPVLAMQLDEVAAWTFVGDTMVRERVDVPLRRKLPGMKGAHPRIQGEHYSFDYLDFVSRLERFDTETAAAFEAWHRMKGEMLERERKRLRLDEFRPKVLSSFVRNQLTDKVYLPMVGDNLAKQIGAAGATKRTDLMGLLLLISPPGYGKTTLMEYVASRLGIVFIKINGPAIGHAVTSLDSAEAPNAAAREEISKLNLALEMGDNVLICIDDIQHCSPEFLQKFISLCDGQRKMEGVWRGNPRTYDLRGRKVVVVMAGNPYTESGQKFKIPDMLANRADTYNLGDVIGANAEWFRASYLENAVTSNPALASLTVRSQNDVRRFVQMAESGERSSEGLEGSYSTQEVDEILAVLRKLVAIRDVVMKVNAEYIASAAQADEFRTEPAFKLQGSYRNMNRLAEKVAAVMNDDELRAMIVQHYRGESQTLTTGAESNLLRFRELLGIQAPAESERWAEIKKTFKRNQFSRGTDNDPAGRVVAQLAGFQSGLEGIQSAISAQLSRPSTPVVLDVSALEKSLDSISRLLGERLERLERLPQPSGSSQEIASSSGHLEKIGKQLGEGLRALGEDVRRSVEAPAGAALNGRVESLSHELEMIHSTLATLKDLAAQQRDHLKQSQELLAARARQGTVEIELTQDMLNNERAFLERFHQAISNSQRPESGDGPKTS